MRNLDSEVEMWMELGEERVQWQALVLAVLNHQNTNVKHL